VSKLSRYHPGQSSGGTKGWRLIHDQGRVISNYMAEWKKLGVKTDTHLRLRELVERNKR
jgi:hypothetical protein